jgi:hypothetical protein
MAERPKTFEIADDTETRARAREVQALLNIVEPDPEYQPFILTDEASLFGAVAAWEDECSDDLRCTFAVIFHFPCASLFGDLWMKLNRFIQTGQTTGLELTGPLEPMRESKMNTTFSTNGSAASR